MNKEHLLKLMAKNDIDDLKKKLVNELITPTNGLFDSAFDEKSDDIIYNGQIEQWRDYGKKYHISNLGRVKYYNTQYIIPQINRNKILYLDRQKWEEKCKKNNILAYKISNDSKVYSEYIKPLWLDELKDNETISERMLAEEIFSEILKNNPDEKLIIHHINNYENDNRVQNLIYIPRSIHGKIHKFAESSVFK